MMIVWFQDDSCSYLPTALFSGVECFWDCYIFILSMIGGRLTQIQVWSVPGGGVGWAPGDPLYKALSSLMEVVEISMKCNDNQ